MGNVIPICANCGSYAIAPESGSRGVLRCRGCGRTLKAKRDWLMLALYAFALLGFVSLAIVAGLG
jgi:uncharacterized paraquat-inducible protein A